MQYLHGESVRLFTQIDIRNGIGAIPGAAAAAKGKSYRKVKATPRIRPTAISPSKSVLALNLRTLAQIAIHQSVRGWPATQKRKLRHTRRFKWNSCRNETLLPQQFRRS